MLEFNTAFEKDILVIELEGSLDSHSATDFRNWFNEKMRSGYRAFAIDCLCLEYVSSAGIGALIDLQAAVALQSGKLVLFQLSGETRQLLRFLQLDSKLHITGDYEDAIAALSGIANIPRKEAPPLVGPDEITVLEDSEQPESEEKPTGNGEPDEQLPKVLAKEDLAANLDKKSSTENESSHSENLGKPEPQPEPEPVATATETLPPATTAEPAPEKAPIPQATEVPANADPRRLISCPNCKSVLRVAIAGEYLCPACRFRFAYKGGNAPGTN
jgi:anti-anti-sigma factor